HAGLTGKLLTGKLLARELLTGELLARRTKAGSTGETRLRWTRRVRERRAVGTGVGMVELGLTVSLGRVAGRGRPGPPARARRGPGSRRDRGTPPAPVPTRAGSRPARGTRARRVPDRAARLGPGRRRAAGNRPARPMGPDRETERNRVGHRIRAARCIRVAH